MLRRLPNIATQLSMLKTLPTHRLHNVRTTTLRQRLLSSSRSTPAKMRQTQEWSLMGGAEHRPSMGGSSLGHLISELSSTKPGMEALRQEGQTMLEDHRTLARNVAKWVIGLPLVFGTAVVGFKWFSGKRGSESV